MIFRGARYLVSFSLLFLAACKSNDTGGSTAVGCAANPAQCVGTTPMCDTVTGRCVQCLPATDKCGELQHCVPSNGGYTCASSCQTDSDCSKTTGAICCFGVCADLTKDPSNCGVCGHACPGGANAIAGCTAGACVIGSCYVGFTDCDAKATNGCEVATSTDTHNCGTCGNVCASGPRARTSCDNGACKFVCDQGLQDCDGDMTNGCETAIRSDVRNCGGCGTVCSGLPNSVTVCTDGTCGVGRCVGWFGDCNKDSSDGCEKNTQSDTANCGACGNACAAVTNGTASCVSGNCVIGSCSKGFADCDGDIGNGCEHNVGTDALNCGACGRACNGANSKQACQNGTCTIAMCNPGFADCDKDVSDGCESNSLVDVKNCGACANACEAVPNAMISCLNASCVVGACNAGFSDCDKDPKNGCEVNQITDVNNCGVCGKICQIANAAQACKGGACAIGMCNQNFLDCDQNVNNGCEAGILVDPNNCGKCGAACTYKNAAGSCNNSVCSMGACNQGFANCNMNPMDGCEIQTTNDPKNCGMCGIVCGQNAPYCVNSVCSNTTHNIAQLVPDYNTGNFNNGCDNSNWWTQNFGPMTYDDCEKLANKYGAQYMGETGFFNAYNAPYQYTTRWVGEGDATNAWIGTGNWSQVILAPKNQQQPCVLAYANAALPGNGTYNTQMVSANGKTYEVTDYGIVSEKVCYTNALASGARPLSPYMFANATKGVAHMIENHQNHGSCQYSGLNAYQADGNSCHNYRCLVGYND